MPASLGLPRLRRSGKFSAAADQTHDFEAVAPVQRQIAQGFARHDFAVALHHHPGKGEPQRFQQRAQRDAVRVFLFLSVDDEKNGNLA